jgi:hypothetical protein
VVRGGSVSLEEGREQGMERKGARRRWQRLLLVQWGSRGRGRWEAAGTGSEPARAGGGTLSREIGEARAQTTGPRLQFRGAVKFNSKSNSNRFELFKL